MRMYYLTDIRKLHKIVTNTGDVTVKIAQDEDYEKGKVTEIDLRSFSLLERLVLSAIWTFIKCPNDFRGVDRNIAPTLIIFGAKKLENLTFGNNIDYIKAINHLISNRADVVTWLEANKDIKKVNRITKQGIFDTPIETDLLFATKAGKHGMGIDAIAWRACALTLAKSPKLIEMKSKLNPISLYSWSDASITNFDELFENNAKKKNVLYHYKYKAKERIKNWLDAVGIEGFFKDSFFTVTGMKKSQEIKIENKENKEKDSTTKTESCIVESLTIPKNSIEAQLKSDLEGGHDKWVKKFEEFNKELGKEVFKKIYKKMTEDYLHPECKEIAKHFKVDSDMVVGSTQGSQSLIISDKNTYFNVKDSLRKLKNETYKLVCDDEDEFEFEDPNERKFAKAYLFRYYWPLMNL